MFESRNAAGRPVERTPPLFTQPPLFAQDVDAGGLLGFVAGLGIVGLVVGLLIPALHIYAPVDAIKNPSLDGTMRIVWVLVILLLYPLLGPILYFLLGRGAKSP